MNRRALVMLGAGAAAGAACVLAVRRPALADLNPDRMWPVYRRFHLLIVSQRDDERNGALTTAVVGVLSRHLPASRPQLVSAADARRIGVLIATNQQDVAIMQADSAEALFLAKPPFDDIHEAPLRIKGGLEPSEQVVECVPQFGELIAWPGQRQPLVEVPGGDRARASRDLTDWREHAAGHEPTER